MNKIQRLLKVILPALCFCTAAFADNVALSNAEASRLFADLRATQAGTTAINTRNGALDINTLRPIVEAFQAGEQVLQSKADRMPANDPQRAVKIDALNAEVIKLTNLPNVVPLTLFTVSDDEIHDAKIPMDSLAEFLRFLQPSKK